MKQMNRKMQVDIFWIKIYKWRGNFSKQMRTTLFKPGKSRILKYPPHLAVYFLFCQCDNCEQRPASTSWPKTKGCSLTEPHPPTIPSTHFPPQLQASSTLCNVYRLPRRHWVLQRQDFWKLSGRNRRNEILHACNWKRIRCSDPLLKAKWDKRKPSGEGVHNKSFQNKPSMWKHTIGQSPSKNISPKGIRKVIWMAIIVLFLVFSKHFIDVFVWKMCCCL